MFARLVRSLNSSWWHGSPSRAEDIGSPAHGSESRAAKDNCATKGSRSTRIRRGSVIIMALAVLAVLAIAAVSYVAIVRIDRDSSAATSKDANYQQQVNAVVSEMQGLLAADLFGKKIVTSAVPVLDWPRMFEDGGATDYPRTNSAWLNNPDPTQAVNQLSVVPTDPANKRLGAPDDAWLASTEPVTVNPLTGVALNAKFCYWPQITNLRSAYKYVRNGNNAYWQRGDGRFVNLLNWFLKIDTTDTPYHANGGVNLLDPTGNAADRIGPIAGVSDIDSGGSYNNTNNTTVYGAQMAQLVDNTSPTVMKNHQEALWADTDGDTRPDARWTQLDSLGNLYGLNWVVAARIIDASALVNFNTAMQFPYGAYVSGGSVTNPVTGAALVGRNGMDVVGTGETPADVDLLRLLTNAQPGAVFSPTVIGGNIFGAGVTVNADLVTAGAQPTFRSFLNKGLGFSATISDFAGPSPHTVANASDPYDSRVDTSPQYPYDNTRQQSSEKTIKSSGIWDGGDWTTRHQRAVMYDKFGSDPAKAVSDASVGLPERDLIDLHAFWCVNNTSVTSTLETLIDGPESNGYLPPASGATAMGPLRSREGVSGQGAPLSDSPRTFSSATPEPSLDRINADIRHLLTPVNGVGEFSPVPIANYPTTIGGVKPAQPQYWDGQYFNSKISLTTLKLISDLNFITRADAQKVFDSFVWALAPLAGDRALFPGWATVVTPAVQTDSSNYYGGTDPTNPANSPAGYIASKTGGGNMGAAYAVIKAAALTANLIDAIDGNGASPSGETFNAAGDLSTTVHLYNTSDLLPATTPNVKELVLGTRLPQGNIPVASLPNQYVPPMTGGGGITFFGAERQPFIVEASSFALYEAGAADTDPTVISPWQGTAANVDDQVGALFAVELFNPWPQSVTYTNYQIIVGNAATGVRMVLDLAQTSDSLASIPPGTSRILYYHRRNTTSTNTDLTTAATSAVAEWKTKLEASGAPAFALKNGDDVSGTDALTFVNAPGVVPPVFFQNLVVQGAPALNVPVLLVRKAVSGISSDVVVDRLSPPNQSAGGVPFPLTLDQTYSYTAPAPYTKANMRLCLGATMYRPNGRSSGVANGFTPAVIERRSANTVAQSTLVPNSDDTRPLADGRQIWLEGSMDTTNSPNDPVPLVEPLIDNVYPTAKLGQSKGAAPYKHAPFQLFVPNRGPVIDLPAASAPPVSISARALFSPSELLQVSTLATMYFNQTASTAPVVADACDLSKSYLGADHQTLLYSPGAWQTMSEQLGSDTELFRDPATGNTPNPYMGVLDPTRFMLPSGALTAAGVPESYKVPLALRVPDCFEALPLPDFLAQGRVNINTAPRKVLELLPFVSPLADIKCQSNIGAADIPQATAGTAASPLASLLLQYRDPTLQGGSPRNTLLGSIANSTGTLASLRIAPASVAPQRGFATPAELAVLGNWQSADGTVVGPGGVTGGRGFMALGGDGNLQAGAPLQRDYLDFVTDTGAASPTGTAPTFKPTDDPEERLAVYRSLANIVSTRSDVYLAWFVLRGYDPQVIERISVNSANNTNDAQAAMDSADFRPTYESRWLVLMDRSNVRKPTDRPRILLKVELPSAKP